MNTNFKTEILNNNTYIFTSDKHKFGIDSFILTNFSKPKANNSIFDIGTGCGIIPLLISSNNYYYKKIIGIDIQPEAIELFSMSIKKLNIAKNIIPILGDIRNIKEIIPNDNKFDLIISNPPFKLENSGILSCSKSDQIARHETMCNMKDIFYAAAYLLNFKGRICICQRPERLPEIISIMKIYNIEPKRLRFVSKMSTTKPWLFLIEGVKGAKPFLNVEPPLFVYEKKEYSNQMKEIYNIK